LLKSDSFVAEDGNFIVNSAVHRSPVEIL